MSAACRLEPDVLEAAARGVWTDALRRHVSECADCTAAASVARWMADFAAVDERQHILPDPAVLWLKAQILRGSSAAEVAARPFRVVQFLAYVMVGGGWAALLTWKWQALAAWVDSLRPTHYFAAEASLSLSFFLGVFVLSTMTIVLALHTIVADE